jgi:hypothetical protein
MSSSCGIHGARPTTAPTLGCPEASIDTAPPIEKPISRVRRPEGSATASRAARQSSMHDRSRFQLLVR